MPAVIAVAVFVLGYGAIASERIDRVKVVLGAAGVLLLFQVVDLHDAFYSEETGVDWNVVFLLLGMMVIVGGLQKTGIFDYLALRAVRVTNGRPFAMLALLIILTAVASALIDNVTTVLLIAPMIISITRELDLPAVPYLLSVVFASNIGGTATLIGDPPNIIIGSQADLDYVDFLLNLAPLVVVLMGVFILTTRLMFGRMTVDPERVEALLVEDPRDRIHDRRMLGYSLAVLSVVTIGFALHGLLHYEPSVIALLGGGVILLITSRPGDLLAEVEWGTLAFFVGLFIMVGSLVKVGVVESIAESLAEFIDGRLLLGCLLLLVVSAFLSAVVDNIPYVATMAPIVATLVADLPAGTDGDPLWWSLAAGADLGGNATPVGASANLIVLAIAARHGHSISFGRFVRFGGRGHGHDARGLGPVHLRQIFCACLSLQRRRCRRFVGGRRRELTRRRGDPSATLRSVRVVIVGAGFGGIAAAIELTSHGYDAVTLLEAAPTFGGTWHHNTYPGAACDVPSHFYSFSFAQRSEWTRLCSPQREILDYLRQVADDHDITRRVVTDQRVSECAWDDTTACWTVRTESGREFVADALVLATGQLNQPSKPRIEGIDDFAGHSFHSARWDHGYDFSGRRVAVIGTGASAVQFVPPLAEAAASLTVFQRTGNWFLPRKNNAYPGWVLTLIRRVPGLRALWRLFWFEYTESLTLMIRHPRTLGRLGWLWSTLFMRMQLRDPEVRRQVWPDYRFGCKRILFSSWFLPALATRRRRAGVRRDRPDDTVRTADSRRHRSRGRLRRLRHRLPHDVVHAADAGLGHRGTDSRDHVGRGPARPPGHLGAGLPVAVHHVRAQHQHLGRLDHLLPRGAGRLHPPCARPDDTAWGSRARHPSRCRARQRPGGAGRVRGHGMGRVQLLVPRRIGSDRDQLARVHARVRPAGLEPRPGRLRLRGARGRAGLIPRPDIVSTTDDRRYRPRVPGGRPPRSDPRARRRTSRSAAGRPERARPAARRPRP